MGDHQASDRAIELLALMLHSAAEERAFPVPPTSDGRPTYYASDERAEWIAKTRAAVRELGIVVRMLDDD